MLQVNNKEGMVFCDCGTEGIQIQYEDDYTYFAIWESGAKDVKTSWKQKWRFIKNILKDGTPYGDQIMLDRAGRDYLIKILQAQNEEEIKTKMTVGGNYEDN